MANEEHVSMLKQGVDAWNAWRRENPDVYPNLRRAVLGGADLGGTVLGGADLREADLREANLYTANLGGANLRKAKLCEADLRGADLREADLCEADLGEALLSRAFLSRAFLSRADLGRANLYTANLGEANLHEAFLVGADLRRADLRRADLGGADLRRADLGGADLREVRLHEAIFGETNLAGATGLEECEHQGPSTLDHRTLLRSGPLPLAFLRGVGLPDTMIEAFNHSPKFYSCFISYSATDQEFADRLYADLQNKGVRCWFAPHDMRTGDKILDTIGEEIRLRDKVLIILSEASVSSKWVEREVKGALDEEDQREQTVLFPIRIDEAVKEASKEWARLLRRERHITDFTGWTDRNSYRKSFERLMRDLKVEQEQAPKS